MEKVNMKLCKKRFNSKHLFSFLISSFYHAMRLNKKKRKFSKHLQKSLNIITQLKLKLENCNEEHFTENIYKNA
jgi:hypothetical protein